MSGFLALEKRPQAAVGPAAWILQRKCSACDSPKAPAAACSSCEDAKPARERGYVPAAGSLGGATAPPIVHDVLQSPGQPLGSAVRDEFESRFGHDFSHVRVHADAKAADSATAVGASAYTVGHHIAFAAGRWSGAAQDGLLAHELAHVVQQSGGEKSSGKPPTISSAQDAAEREADTVAREVMASRQARPKERNGPGLFRQGLAKPVLPLTPADKTRVASPAGMGDLHIAERQHEKEQAKDPRKQVSKMEWEPLGPADIDQIKAAGFGAAKATTSAISKPVFVLHDTDGWVKEKYISARKKEGIRSAAEKGAVAWVPKTELGKAEEEMTIVSDSLFVPRRVTATKTEQGEREMIEKDRERNYRAVWKLTKPVEAAAALNKLLDTQKSKKGTPKKRGEFETESAKVSADLGATSGKVYSAAQWTVEDICDQVSASTAEKLAIAPEKAPDLVAACERLRSLFKYKKELISSTVNVEIVQDKKPSEGGKKQPLTYSEKQYEDVKKLYLLAALEAHHYPEITTHARVDRGISDGHHDPRCFDVHLLYSKVAATLGHLAGCTYGIDPLYCEGPSCDISWSKSLCGREPPK